MRDIKEEGIVVVLPATGLTTGAGTKFFTNDGQEIKGVTNFEVKPTGVDDILLVSITAALVEVRYELPEQKWKDVS